MRTLNELYIILWDKIKDKSCIYSLCYEIDCLYKYEIITNSEHAKIYKHLNKNKPNNKRHSEFLKSNTWIGMAWWWDLLEPTNPVNRKAFVQKMKKITKKERNHENT